MNYLITGGCGFIGKSLIENISKNKRNKIRIIDNQSVGKISDIENYKKFFHIKADECSSSKSKYQIITEDIRNIKVCMSACKGIDIVIHLAANTKIIKSLKNPIYDFNVNLKGTLNLLEASNLNRVKRFVYASSAAIGGNIKPPINEKIIPKPISPYGASKLGGEAYCSTFFETYDLETVILRFGNVYGPGSLKKTSVVAKFIKNILANKDIYIFGDGRQTRDYIYIDDIVNAIKKAANKPNIGGEVFQIATSRETSVQELKDVILKKIKKYSKNNIKVFYSNSIKGEIKRNYSDTRKAKNILNWEAKTFLDAGIEKTIKYFLKNS